MRWVCLLVGIVLGVLGAAAVSLWWLFRDGAAVDYER